MRALRKLIPVIVAVLLCAALVPSLKASDRDKKTVVTFSGPVEIPGQVLSAGTYVFTLLDSASNIVQVWNQDQTELLATTEAVPTYALQAPEKPMFNFEHRGANSPSAIQAWFYPGDTLGYEFVYEP
jgi:hypothetical protein